MREIVHVSLGQCGNQIGAKFWELISDEHDIDSTGTYISDTTLQLERINVFYDEASGGRFAPRAIFVDLDPATESNIKTSACGSIYKPSNFIFGGTGAYNNWAKGHYTEGADLIDSVFDTLRNEVEKCDSLHGFQITQSLGGGTGSGMGALLLTKLREEFTDRIIQTFSVVPSNFVTDCVVEPYNSVLSFYHLIENTDICMTIDNQALYNICLKSFKIPVPTYGDLNHLASVLMSNTTCSLRFPGQVNSDLRRLAVNLAPFPRAHFLMSSCAPIQTRDSSYFRSPTMTEMAQQIFDPKNMLCYADLSKGKCLAGSAVIRGKVSFSDFYDNVKNMRDKNSSSFMEWIPDNLQYSAYEIPPKGTKKAALLIANSTSIQEMFNRVYEQYAALYRRKSFLHLYIQEGMDEMEFIEAESSLNELISEYQQYSENSTTIDDYEEEN